MSNGTMQELGKRSDEPVSGTVNAPGLGLWALRATRSEDGRPSPAYTLGRKSDGVQLPGMVIGNLDRARRCWHALLVLHSNAEDIILSIGIDPSSSALLADWKRLTD